MADLIPCPLCGGAGAHPYAVRYREGYPHHARAYCRRCGIAFANPMASEEELREFYTRYYDKGQFGADLSKAQMSDLASRWATMSPEAREREQAHFAQYYRLPRNPGTFLDVGCGLGRSLFLAAHAGWEVAGVDYDEDLSAFARRCSRAPIWWRETFSRGGSPTTASTSSWCIT